jgi:hypothetical protein
LIVIEQIQLKLEEPSTPDKAIRALLLLEQYLRTDLVKPTVYKEMFSNVLQGCISKCDDKVSIKAKKVSLIINVLK